jgi:hypothetical protein
MLPVFTDLTAIFVAIVRNRQWSSLQVLQLDGGSLVENKDPAANIVVNPWMRNELQ